MSARVHSWGVVPLVLMLAASATTLAPAGGPTPESGTTPWSGGDLVGAMRHLDGPAYEPTLGITAAGNVFYLGGTPQNDAAIPGEAWVHGSYDNGATWVNTTSAIAANDHEIYDPFLYVDRDTGRIFRLMMQAQSVGGNGCMQLIWSDDEGATWGEEPMLCISPPFHDHESLATGEPRGSLVPSGDYPNLVHVCLNHAQGTECAVSLDGAQSFLPPHLVFPSVDPTKVGGAWCGGLNSPVTTDGEGRVFVPRLHCDVPKVAVSDDGGLTWELRTLPGPLASRGHLFGVLPGIEPQYIDLNVMHMAVDAADHLHVVYVAADGLPYYLRSADHGATWTQAQRIAAPGITAVATSLITVAAGAEDHVAFAYVATDHPGGYTAASWEGATWNMHVGVLAGAESDALWTQINDDEDLLGVDDCGVTRCTECPDELCPGMYDYIDAEVAPDGRPWVAMVDVCHALCRQTGMHDVARGAVGTLASGPSLTRPGEALPLLTWS